MRLDQFTVKAQEALAGGQTAAEREDHPEFSAEHLLQALLRQLYAYRVGDRLVDAQVRAVESTDVLLETDEGPLRIPLPALPD